MAVYETLKVVELEDEGYATKFMLPPEIDDENVAIPTG